MKTADKPPSSAVNVVMNFRPIVSCQHSNKKPLCMVVHHAPWKFEQVSLFIEASLSGQLFVPDDVLPCRLQKSKSKQFSLKYLG